jgi:hypothetical protein
VIKQIVSLTESDLHRIVKKSVNKILRESSYDETENIVAQFAENITGLDENTAMFVARELSRAGDETLATMKFIVEHNNGYGYGGPDINGNYDY